MPLQTETAPSADSPNRTQPIFLTTKQLAARWGMAPGTLNNRRWQGTGIPFVKNGHRVMYRLADIEAFERQATQTSTSGS